MMVALSIQERVSIQLGRNKKLGIKPNTNRDIAKYIGKSPVYVGDIIKEQNLGPKGRRYLEKIKAYVGI